MQAQVNTINIMGGTYPLFSLRIYNIEGNPHNPVYLWSRPREELWIADPGPSRGLVRAPSFTRPWVWDHAWWTGDLTGGITIIWICIILQASWSHLGVMLESCWSRFGVILGSFWSQFGVVLAPSWTSGSRSGPPKDKDKELQTLRL